MIGLALIEIGRPHGIEESSPLFRRTVGFSNGRRGVLPRISPPYEGGD